MYIYPPRQIHVVPYDDSRKLFLESEHNFVVTPTKPRRVGIVGKLHQDNIVALTLEDKRIANAMGLEFNVPIPHSDTDVGLAEESVELGIMNLVEYDLSRQLYLSPKNNFIVLLNKTGRSPSIDVVGKLDNGNIVPLSSKEKSIAIDIGLNVIPIPN